ncbi:sulfurtransferase TusA family protein [Thiohalophilus sp.]|uniref:sulfurtransferase TusA family protein n=1 Tax=Thiohalophilus sp. TaxID=3028392 RepID=UPI002ACDE6C1|nr:sulfurtransferase TusA family protein [Thiohalophilus sp.]MDZ7663312.1 sulfurtransferase TusA family protein [Thiohalophilus sp.]
MGLFSKKNETAATEAGSSVTLEDGSTVEVSRVVDALGDSCPRPQLKTKKALKESDPGMVIEVRIDNPTSMAAIPPMMPEVKSTHLGTVKDGRYWRVIVRKN